jgi:hypothetical protein
MTRIQFSARVSIFFYSWPYPDWLSNGYEGIFPRGKVAKCDHSLPSSAEVMNMWSYTSMPPYIFAMWSIKILHPEV